MTRCEELVQTRQSIGFHQGTERFVAGGLRQCKHKVADGDTLCVTHRKQADHRTAVLAARRQAAK